MEVPWNSGTVCLAGVVLQSSSSLSLSSMRGSVSLKSTISEKKIETAVSVFLEDQKLASGNRTDFDAGKLSTLKV